LGVGTAFGDSVLTGKAHSVSVFTNEKCTLLRVRRETFRELWSQNVQLLGHVVSPMCDLQLSIEQATNVRRASGASADVNNNALPVELGAPIAANVQEPMPTTSDLGTTNAPNEPGSSFGWPKVSMETPGRCSSAAAVISSGRNSTEPLNSGQSNESVSSTSQSYSPSTSGLQRRNSICAINGELHLSPAVQSVRHQVYKMSPMQSIDQNANIVSNRLTHRHSVAVERTTSSAWRVLRSRTELNRGVNRKLSLQRTPSIEDTSGDLVTDRLWTQTSTSTYGADSFSVRRESDSYVNSAPNSFSRTNSMATTSALLQRQPSHHSTAVHSAVNINNHVPCGQMTGEPSSAFVASIANAVLSTPTPPPSSSSSASSSAPHSTFVTSSNSITGTSSSYGDSSSCTTHTSYSRTESSVAGRQSTDAPSVQQHVIGGLNAEPETPTAELYENCSGMNVSVLRAGKVMRSLIACTAPHLLKDRKLPDRTTTSTLAACSVVGSELVDWMLACSTGTAARLHSRFQASAMLQVLLEEGVLVRLDQPTPHASFEDKYVFYKFCFDLTANRSMPEHDDWQSMAAAATAASAMGACGEFASSSFGSLHNPIGSAWSGDEVSADAARHDRLRLRSIEKHSSKEETVSGGEGTPLSPPEVPLLIKSAVTRSSAKRTGLRRQSSEGGAPESTAPFGGSIGSTGGMIAASMAIAKSALATTAANLASTMSGAGAAALSSATQVRSVGKEVRSMSGQAPAPLSCQPPNGASAASHLAPMGNKDGYVYPTGVTCTAHSAGGSALKLVALAGSSKLENEWMHCLQLLGSLASGAMFRLILKKVPEQRTADEIDLVYTQLMHVKAFSSLSNSIRQELACVMQFEAYRKSGSIGTFQSKSRRSNWTSGPVQINKTKRIYQKCV
jgi:hypothetical protein